MRRVLVLAILAAAVAGAAPARAQWLLILDGKKDWEVHRLPAVPE